MHSKFQVYEKSASLVPISNGLGLLPSHVKNLVMDNVIPLLQTKTADTANTECDQVLFLFVVIVVVVVAIVVVVVVTVVVIVVAIVVVATVVVIVAIVVVVVLGGAREQGHPSLFCCSELQCTIVISHMFSGQQGRWEGLGTIKLG